jgi:ribonuclease III
LENIYDMQRGLGELSVRMNVQFRNEAFLRSALCHSSYVNEVKSGVTSNERLEFLGDSVLSLIVSEHLYQRFPDSDEGFLSSIRAYVVSERVLSEISAGLGIGDFLLLGRGEIETGGRFRKSNLANALEAVLGVIYLDSGLESARTFILPLLEPYIEPGRNKKSLVNYKTKLQEFCQKKFKAIPIYIVTKEWGPDHDKNFLIKVQVGSKQLGMGEGKSIQKAEQNAARNSLLFLNVIKS